MTVRRIKTYEPRRLSDAERRRLIRAAIDRAVHNSGRAGHYRPSKNY